MIISWTKPIPSEISWSRWLKAHPSQKLKRNPCLKPYSCRIKLISKNWSLLIPLLSPTFNWQASLRFLTYGFFIWFSWVCSLSFKSSWNAFIPTKFTEFIMCSWESMRDSLKKVMMPVLNFHKCFRKNKAKKREKITKIMQTMQMKITRIQWVEWKSTNNTLK